MTAARFCGVSSRGARETERQGKRIRSRQVSALLLVCVTALLWVGLAEPAVVKRLTELGQEIPPREQLTSQALAAYHKAEIDRWWPLIKSANIKID